MIFEHDITRIKLADLVFDNLNPNRMSIEQMASLRAAMERFGYLNPIIIDQNNKIADGEHRALIYKEFGLTEIPAYRVTFSHDSERMLLRQTMNKLRGQHDPTLDAEEMFKLYEANKLPDLSNLIAQQELALKDLMLRFKPELPVGHETDDQLDKIIDEQLAKTAPDTKLADRYQLGNHTLICSDNSAALPTISDNSVDMVITSPPYWNLRDYKEEGQIGRESSYHEYINELIEIFNEIKRILKPTGSCWVNMGDSYNTKPNNLNPVRPYISANTINERAEANKNRIISEDIQEKSLTGIPERFMIAMLDNNWLCRNTIIWHKPNPMPSSAKDRFTIDFEYLFFFTKSQQYYFNTQYEPLESSNKTGWRNQHIKFGGNKAAGYENPVYSGNEYEPSPNGRIKRCVWKISPAAFPDAHFAVFPIELLITPIKATCPPDGLILDPFVGSGTTIIAAEKFDRKAIGIDLSPRYCDITCKRYESYTGNKAQLIS